MWISVPLTVGNRWRRVLGITADGDLKRGHFTAEQDVSLIAFRAVHSPSGQLELNRDSTQRPSAVGLSTRPAHLGQTFPVFNVLIRLLTAIFRVECNALLIFENIHPQAFVSEHLLVA